MNQEQLRLKYTKTHDFNPSDIESVKKYCEWLEREIIRRFEMDDNKVILPRTLTAENGAKNLLMGEFHESLVIPCICGGEGCDECHGAGEFSQAIPIQWTTIKEIYQKIVTNLETTQ